MIFTTLSYIHTTTGFNYFLLRVTSICDFSAKYHPLCCQKHWWCSISLKSVPLCLWHFSKCLTPILEVLMHHAQTRRAKSYCLWADSDFEVHFNYRDIKIFFKMVHLRINKIMQFLCYRERPFWVSRWVLVKVWLAGQCHSANLFLV